MRGEPDTALLVFPTKALAQDQLRSLRSWLVPGLQAVTYDGDTPPDDRAWARKHANVALTNPEMLHQGILPYHRRWATFLMRLRIVVVDELYAVRGIFGSNVADVLRRLQRCARTTRRSPSFCFASAMIGNPAELATAPCGLPVTASRTTACRRPSGASGCGNAPCSTSTRDGGARPTGRPPSCSPGSYVTDDRRSCSPAAGAARSWSRPRPGDGSSPTRPSSRNGSRCTGRATSPRSDASWSAGSLTAACWASTVPDEALVAVVVPPDEAVLDRGSGAQPDPGGGWLAPGPVHAAVARLELLGEDELAHRVVEPGSEPALVARIER